MWDIFSKRIQTKENLKYHVENILISHLYILYLCILIIYSKPNIRKGGTWINHWMSFTQTRTGCLKTRTGCLKMKKYKTRVSTVQNLLFIHKQRVSQKSYNLANKETKISNVFQNFSQNLSFKENQKYYTEIFTK